MQSIHRQDDPMPKPTVIFCPACSWARPSDGVKTFAEVKQLLNNGCPDCGHDLRIDGCIKKEHKDETAG
jgi:hypothetical protein